MTVSATLLSMRDIHKSFGGAQALKGASFSLERGEAHAIMGINGSGKSTLMKVLCGAYVPDSGTIVLEGRETDRFASPREAERAGISIVYQEVRLMQELSVAENVYMGHFPYRSARLGIVDWQRIVEGTRDIFRRIGMNMDPRARVADLSVGRKQMVEIAKALSIEGAKILILDEPTSALTDEETERLFAVMKNLKTMGMGLVYITHKLQELNGHVDRVTVLRDGRDVLTTAMREDAVPGLIDAMLGEKFVKSARLSTAAADGGPVLSVRSLSGPRLPGPVHIEVRGGEIVGLVGQMGSGRSETLRAVMGLDPVAEGEVRFLGEPISGTPGRIIRKGIGYVPEDRKTESIIPGRSVGENVTIGILRQLVARGRLSRRLERGAVASVIREVDLRPASPALPVDNLSGGNQQKAMLGRWLNLDNLRLLLLDEPTRGVDVGAKKQIYGLLAALTAKGLAVLIASSDIEEVLEICDRVILMRGGAGILERPVGQLDMASLTALIVGEGAGERGNA